MTPTLIFWIKAGIIALLVWAVWSIVKVIRKQQKIIPSSNEEWRRLVSELLFAGVMIFLFFWIQKTFQGQINTVLDAKNKPLQGLSFINLQTSQPDSLAAYKGKVVIVNLWATWCGPCLSELPELDQLQNEYGKEIAILALSDERAEIIEQFRKSKSYRMIMGPYQHHPLLDSLNSRPVSILLNKNQEIQDVVIGAKGIGFFKKWVKPYLK
jgi:thiol-disulfide isomerase/thioredoxin